MNGLDLFSGIGGITYALQEWIRPIAYCEIDTYCQSVLLSRQSTGDLPVAPIWDDISTFEGEPFKGIIDIFTAGFPCQDISITGFGRGLEGKRSGLFFQIMRLAKEIQPKFLFLENVPAITTRGGLDVVREIASLGYDCRWCIISAASVGAMHKRERWFLLAYSKSQRLQKERQPKRQKEAFSKSLNKAEYNKWDKEPENKFEMARVADGVSPRVHRIRALGNAVVPAQAKKAFEILIGEVR